MSFLDNTCVHTSQLSLMECTVCVSYRGSVTHHYHLYATSIPVSNDTRRWMKESLRNRRSELHWEGGCHQQSHYIPHHLVRKESATTPVRIVYDCSCKQSPDSPSLNDCLHPGPPFLNDLCAILFCFRQHSLAFFADIEEAFLHVYLDEANRHCTRFPWLSDHTDEAFITYQFRVVLFSSPFMLNVTLTFYLTEHASPVSKDLFSNLHVDNLLSGCATEQAAPVNLKPYYIVQVSIHVPGPLAAHIYKP